MVPVQGVTPYLFALFPGLGHFYLRRNVKAVAYGLPFWFVVVMFFLIAAEGGYGTRQILPVLVIGDIILWIVAFVDTLLTIQRIKTFYMHSPMYQMSVDPYGHPAYHNQGHMQQQAYNPNMGTYAPPTQGPAPTPPQHGPAPAQPGLGAMNGQIVGQPPYGELYDPERSKLKWMSLIPGLGHFHLGLMQRGMSTMALFFGIIVFVIFIARMTSDSFIAFLLVLPVLWFYSLFDTLNLYKRKKAGETLVDHSFFEDFYQNRSTTHKNRTVATLLSIFPGAGHLYLGVQRRGIQLMVGFLVSLYLLDVMRISFFLFLIPIFWFFSFFDSLQIISRFEQEAPKDEPIVNSVIHYRKWIGFGLLLLGLYYIFNNLAPQLIGRLYNGQNSDRVYEIYWDIQNYMRVGVVALILIIAGIYLLVRRNKKTDASASASSSVPTDSAE